ncbi:MAG: PP2C family protein-serine/threonine phosphatase [Bdellovibrionia bacterium]
MNKLLEKTKMSVRMEAELETANLVQRTLFPQPLFKSASIELAGINDTASECGGDLWHYYEVKNRIYLFIGDVVGHGVPSALMTTAARAVTAILELQPEKSPGEILTLLNQAIFETSKGKMWMTFFVAYLDKQTGEIYYANASHNAPFVFKAKEKLKKSEIDSMMEISGPSLGREKSPIYKEYKHQLHNGDYVLFYTDGLSECVNEQKEQLGEVGLIKALLKIWSHQMSVQEFTSKVDSIVQSHRGTEPYEDDITYFVVNWKK